MPGFKLRGKRASGREISPTDPGTGSSGEAGHEVEDTWFELVGAFDLNLDWKSYMSNETKIALDGTYVQDSDVEVLSTPDNKAYSQIRIYTDNASRDARKLMLQCRNSDFKFGLMPVSERRAPQPGRLNKNLGNPGDWRAICLIPAKTLIVVGACASRPKRHGDRGPAVFRWVGKPPVGSGCGESPTKQ